MESVCDKKKFLFTYNNIIDISLNSDYKIQEFLQGRFIAVEFSIYPISFKSKSNPKGTLNYNFCLKSIYLVNNEKPKPMSNSTNWEQNPDK